MPYHIGDGVGGFGFAGNVRDPVRLQDRNVVTRKWGNEKTQEEGETAVHTRKNGETLEEGEPP